MKVYKLLIVVVPLAAILFSVYCLIAAWLDNDPPDVFVVNGLILSIQLVVLYFIIKIVKQIDIDEFEIDYLSKEADASLLCYKWDMDYSGINRYLFLKFIYARDKMKLLGKFDENKHKRLAFVLFVELLQNVSEQEVEDSLLKEAREYWALKYPKIAKNKKFIDKVEKKLVGKKDD
ncbi:MAG: hypothetical protein KatS3mg083_611 [Candidatus Dojkabacteria bacterium]|nr:MAG: hypothetical protein KatS3mg083_611 [Candidatus Dojkabacteria bacterium]